MDRRGRVDRRLAAPQRPRARLLVARCEEADQPELVAEAAHDLLERRGALAELPGLVAELERVLAHVDAGGTLADWSAELPSGLEPLTTKPLLAIENGPSGIDLKLEAELAELPAEEAGAFREGTSALEEVVRRLSDELGLISFFTAGDKETRAWSLRRGETALDAAATIHTDIARGFIRVEVIRWDDLVKAGSHAEAARSGLQRLEGKTYVVQDGDVLNVRFNV